MGAVLYYSALHAEKTAPRDVSKAGVSQGAGRQIASRNAERKAVRVRSAMPIPKSAPRLELYAAGAYLWIPFQHIASVQYGSPQAACAIRFGRPAFVLTGPAFKGTDIGQVIIPAVYPFSWKSDDESLWLGRGTEWVSGRRRQRIPGRPEDVHRGWRGSAAAGDPVAGVRFRCHFVTNPKSDPWRQSRRPESTVRSDLRQDQGGPPRGRRTQPGRVAVSSENWPTSPWSSS